ncbi:MAG: type VII toxin-antitoxin system MntA family adenylyltransferase antitoxin [Thermodesulfovibrionales bacterium]
MDVLRFLKKALIKEVRARKLPVRIVYLYGSFARSTERAKSDIDLAFLFDEEAYCKNPLRYFMSVNEICGKLEKEIKREIDLSILNRASLIFSYHVITSGRPLYLSSKTSLYKYECKIMGMFFDFKPFLDAYLIDYAKA